MQTLRTSTCVLRDTQQPGCAYRSITLPRGAPLARFQQSGVESNPASANFTEPPKVASSRASLLSNLEAAVPQGNVYGKPFSKTELAALRKAVEKLQAESHASAAVLGQEALQGKLLAFLKDAAINKTAELQAVEGAMVMLELLYLSQARSQADSPGSLQGVMSPREMLCRWQLVVGADVGSIQYIPVVEELQVAPGGASFALDTDLGALFTGFSGESEWLSAGHLCYLVKSVRLELRPPKGWSRALIWLRWRAQQASSKARGKLTDGDAPDYGQADPTANTCKPDPGRPALTLPLPFPANELFVFNSNGELATTRSKLGGLILLLNKSTPPVAGR